MTKIHDLFNDTGVLIVVTQAASALELEMVPEEQLLNSIKEKLAYHFSVEMMDETFGHKSMPITTQLDPDTGNKKFSIRGAVIWDLPRFEAMIRDLVQKSVVYVLWDNHADSWSGHRTMVGIYANIDSARADIPENIRKAFTPKDIGPDKIVEDYRYFSIERYEPQ